MLRVPALIFSLSGIAGLGELLVHPLVDQVRRHLVVELVVEPGRQPPRLGPERRALRQQRRLGMGLLEVLEDRGRIRQHQVVDLQHRHLARGVHPQEIHPPLPRSAPRPARPRSSSPPAPGGSCGRRATAADGRDGAFCAFRLLDAPSSGFPASFSTAERARYPTDCVPPASCRQCLPIIDLLRCEERGGRRWQPSRQSRAASSAACSPRAG